MRIQTVNINLTERDTTAIDAWLASVITQPLDDIPLAHDQNELASMVSNKAIAIFRVEDDPFVLGVWQKIGSAAIVYTLWQRSLECIDLLLLDTLPSLPPMVLAALSAPEIETLERQQGPTLARFTVRQNEQSFAGILGFIGYMPVWCELHDLD